MKNIKNIFTPKGLLSANMPGFESRPSQGTMAQKVEFALKNEEILLYEAPTGTGKTIAYLIPVILYPHRVVISTGTKALQEQIINKDLPLAQKVLGKEVKSALMKGRQNYLCKNRLWIFLAQPTFKGIDETSHFNRLLDWSSVTKTGDREELYDLPDDFSAWPMVNSNPNYCRGQNCPLNQECFFTKMKMTAARADIIIVNHHLFFADLAVRENGATEVIPRYQAVILDEAHQIEDVATQFFGTRISNYRIEELARDVSAQLGILKINDNKIVTGLKNLRSASEYFFVQFSKKDMEKFRLRENMVDDNIFEAQAKLTQSLESVGRNLSGIRPENDPDIVKALESRTEELIVDLDKVLAVDNETQVHWVEIRKGGVFVNASPIELAGPIAHALFDCAKSMTLCSATLTTDNNFEFYKNRIGLELEAIEEIGDSCFDYQNQGVLYLPRDLPYPNDPYFVKAVALEMEKILLASKGRGFCLFTSYRNMHAVYDLIADNLPFPVLLQGHGAKSALLEKFRKDEHSVLFATASFWGGVDVVGSSLSVVLIDKLPFASPGEPLVESRIEVIKKNEGNPFMDYQLPQAIITLKQGLGRLIRNKGDRGLLGVFDARIRAKHYGRRILSSLPGFPITGDLEKVCQYLEHLDKSNSGP